MRRDYGATEGILSNLKRYRRGTWNARMSVETALSLVTTVCRSKMVFHRSPTHVEARLAHVAAMFKVRLRLNRTLQPEADPLDRLYHLAQFAL